jgi:predicted Zn-dependent protease
MPPSPWWLRAAVGFACAAAVSCAANPTTGKREVPVMSEAQQIQAGTRSDAEVRRQLGVYDDPGLQAYVQDVGRRVAAVSERPGLPWHFAVVDVAAVNAFALPGGYVYISRGILPYLADEAELACLIGHEIGHVAGGHAARQYTRATASRLGPPGLGVFVPEARRFGGVASRALLGLLFLEYSREDEVEADSLAARYAARAGWDPAGVGAMLATLARLGEAADRRGIPSWSMTHPDPAGGVSDVVPTVGDLLASAGAARWIIGREAYLPRIDGIVFGDNPREGFVRGEEFVHPDLGFVLRFPPGWQVSHDRAQVVIGQPDRKRFLVARAAARADSVPLSAFAREDMAKAGLRGTDQHPLTVNGLQAVIGLYRGKVDGIGRATVRAAHIADGGRVYVVAGLARSGDFAAADPLFMAAIRSFRRLDPQEAAGIRPSRIALYVARPGDTWGSIARATGGIVMPEALAALNSLDVADSPLPGSRVKVVVGG